VSILNTLNDEDTVGSLVDPVTGGVNPYGLDVAKVTSGPISKGDLVVCDFNNSSNVQGTGRSVLVIHPAIGSKPHHITDLAPLLGCNAIAMAPNGTIWAAAFGANDNPVLTSSGTLITALRQFHWHHPFGEAFVPAVNAHSVPAFYVSNAQDGSLVRVGVTAAGFTFTTIVTGFPVNGGAPGSILSPSGLNYQPNGDILYVVDGTNNALYSIAHISAIGANGIKVNGLSFSGPQAANAKVVFHGAPLNGPISSALLFNGNIVLGNTLDPNGKNLMVEISPAGTLLAVKNVDTGAAGSIFGMVATGTTQASTKLYFNDDNANALMVLEP
jgi:sugar lactone lactonase YvrE